MQGSANMHMRSRLRRPMLAVAAAGVGLLTACTGGGSGDGRADAEAVPEVPQLNPASSMTADGRELAAGVDWAQRPSYDVAATIDPVSGEVTGSIDAVLPVGAGARTAALRYFAGLDDFDADASVSAVRVDGEAVDAALDQSLLTVPLADGHGERVRVAMDFTYTLAEQPPADPFAGLLGGSDNLRPSAIGLLARHEQGMSLGHWFPLWMQDAADAVPDPTGFGDIGNFPAGSMSVQLSVPAGYTVVTGGVRVESEQVDGRQVVRDQALGARDLSAFVVEDFTSVSDQVGDIEVVVYGPPADAAALDEALAESTASLTALQEAFGPYPWQELEVVSVPLGAGVGGMEWPGVVWIETSILAGGLPGLGDLGDMGGLGDLLGGEESPFGDEVFGELFEDLLGESGLGAALDPVALGNIRSWTIAHEIGHQWWHAMVGNDSITAPAVDEPLAQYSACVVFRAEWPDVAEQVCEFNTDFTYQQMRMMGIEDTAAAQPSEEFDSSLQYGGVVYGKAPNLYLELVEQFGAGAVQAALADFVAAHPFGLVDTEALRTSLGAALGDQASVDRLWERWLHGAHGDTDIGMPEGGGLGGLGDLSDLFGGEPGEAGDLDDLFGDSEDSQELLELLEELLSDGVGEPTAPTP